MRKTIVTSEVIVLGRQGEDQANKVLFPVRGWKELYGDGQFVVTALRPDENDPYPVTTHIYEEDDPNVTRRGVFVEWIVDSADVEIPGRGKVELAYYTSDDVRVKSVVYHTVIYDSLGQNSLTPPEPWESWVDDVREAGADAIQAAEDAAASAEGAAQSADDAQESADNAEQYANSARDSAELAEDYADDARESAENAATAVSTAFGQITATATTLSPDSPATASFDPSTKVMHFGIPKGDTGDDGAIFWAEFGVTLYDDVRAAINAGKYVVAKYGNKVGVLVESPTSFITFVCLMSAHVYFWALASMDTWTESEATYERRGQITVGNTTYTPTRKALAITENGVTTTYYVADITNT